MPGRSRGLLPMSKATDDGGVNANGSGYHKLASLSFQSQDASAPTYLSDLLHLYVPSRKLRSSADPLVFRIPSFHTKSSGQHSFSYQAPTKWNKLPASVRHASSVSSFKSSLKTFLFLETFFSPPALRCMCVSRCVFVYARARARVCVCVCVFACERACMRLLFVYLNF